MCFPAGTVTEFRTWRGETPVSAFPAEHELDTVACTGADLIDDLDAGTMGDTRCEPVEEPTHPPRDAGRVSVELEGVGETGRITVPEDLDCRVAVLLCAQPVDGGTGSHHSSRSVPCPRSRRCSVPARHRASRVRCRPNRRSIPRRSRQGCRPATVASRNRSVHCVLILPRPEAPPTPKSHSCDRDQSPRIASEGRHPFLKVGHRMNVYRQYNERQRCRKTGITKGTGHRSGPLTLTTESIEG